MKRILFISVFLIIAPPGIAVTAEFDFTEQVSEKRYANYISKIRCLVCQNESLGSSRAELAVDLRQQIFKMMSDGKSDQQISTFLIERYGDFILYQPPLKASTLVLWFAPFLLLGALLFMLLQRIKKMQITQPTQLTTEQKKHARRVLNSDGEQ